MTEILGNLKSAMEEFARVTEQVNDDKEVKDLRYQMDDLHAKMNILETQLAVVIKPFYEKIDELREYIKAQVLELGSSASHNGVEAKYRKGYTSETYPVKEVRKILLATPAILPAFNAISVTKEIAPSVSVSYKAPDNAQEV